MAKDVYVAVLAAVLAIIMILGFHATCPLYAATKPPILRSVSVMDVCQPCHKLIDELRDNGADLFYLDTEYSVSYYPRCSYSDGTKDSGQKVYDKKCVFAKPVVIFRLKEKK